MKINWKNATALGFVSHLSASTATYSHNHGAQPHNRLQPTLIVSRWAAYHLDVSSIYLLWVPRRFAICNNTSSFIMQRCFWEACCIHACGWRIGEIGWLLTRRLMVRVPIRPTLLPPGTAGNGPRMKISKCDDTLDEPRPIPEGENVT